MAAVISQHSEKPMPNSALHGAVPAAAGGTAASPHAKTPFASMLAKIQAHNQRAVGATRTTSSPPPAPAAATASPARPGRTPNASAATAQHEATDASADPPADPANASTKNGTIRPSGVGTPAAAHAAQTPPAPTIGDVDTPAALPPVAALPDLMPNATIEPVGDADPGTIDPSLSDPFATATATLIPPLAAASSASVEATLDDADDAPAESPSAPDSPSAAPLTPTAPGPDANITTTGLLPQHAPTDTAGAPPSPQSVPQSAHAAPDPPGWTEARGTVAFTLSDAVKDGVQNVSIDLHPAELGHVGIQLSFHASGVSVQMTLSRQDTYEAFSRDRAALEQQLAQTGIHLGNGGLDLRFDQKRDQPPAFSESAFTTRIRPVQPDTAVQPPAGPRAAHGLLNIIA